MIRSDNWCKVSEVKKNIHSFIAHLGELSSQALFVFSTLGFGIKMWNLKNISCFYR